MDDEDIEDKAVRLAEFILKLFQSGTLSRSMARKALDRLALRLDNAGLKCGEEAVSTIYMSI